MKNPWIIPAATLVVGAAGGYLVAKNSGSTDASKSPEMGEKSALRSSSRNGSFSASADREKSGSSAQAKRNASSAGEKGSNRIQTMLDHYSKLSAEQLAEEAKKLDRLPMGERIMNSMLLFARWGEVDPNAAIAFSQSMGMAGGFVRPTILQNWASVDPAAAAKYIESNPREFATMGAMGGPMGGRGASSVIAAEWARKDPEAALDWANSLGAGKKEALEAIIGEVSKTDPEKATKMLAAMPADQRAETHRTLATQYGASDFAAAQAWVRSLAQEDQASAMAAAIGGLATADPNAALSELAKLPAGPEKDGLIPRIIESLARQNPKAAADLLMQQTNDSIKENSMRTLMPSYTAQDPKAAYAFANSLPDGRARDQAIQSYIWSNNKTAPSELFVAAETITDEGDRNRAAGIAAMRWMREDPESAKKAIQSSTAISDETKKRISEGRGMFGGGPGGPPGGFRRPGGN